MQRISLITEDHHFASLLTNALAKNAHCEVHTLTDATPSRAEPYGKPDIVIVDLSTLSRPKAKFVPALRRQHPQAAIVAIVKGSSPCFDEHLELFGVDEVIIRPPDAKLLHLIEKNLLEQIALHRHLQSLQERLRREMRQEQIVARSKPMRQILQQLPSLSASQSTVLITGETGTGKELIARAIHYLGRRAGGPFITVDCGALPDNLVENELFGHARGAYTDAGPATRGLIAEADGGTLFLDEIEALPLPAQAKFLRFLQEHQYKPLGQTKYLAVDVRVLAATNVDLARAVEENRFRKDLYFRLNVLPLWIPPLRQRKTDIPALVQHFLQVHAPKSQPSLEIPETLLREWLAYDWPGNVRELENKVQEWLALGALQIPPAAPGNAESANIPLPTIAEVRQAALRQAELTYLRQLLQRTSGNLSAAARLAKIDRKNLRNLLKKHGLEANRFREH